MRYTKKQVQILLDSINDFLDSDKPTFKTAFRNGFIYIEYCDTNNTIFNSATTTRELCLSLYAFREGIYINQKGFLNN